MDWQLIVGDREFWRLVVISCSWILATAAGGWVIHALLFRLWRKHTGSGQSLSRTLLKHWRGPLGLMIPLLFILLVAPSLQLPEQTLLVGRRLFSIGFIVAVAWLLVSSVFVLRDLILSRYDVTVKDNLKARAVHTQVKVLVKIALVVIGVIAAGCLMMIFDNIRQLGVSLLASAGVLGIIVGLAAQRSIATLLAGLQIALTQPIGMDDVVIVEGEWGRIEEITLTYVVVRIWDLRRLVVPVTHFLEKPFQNWTRVSADLLGTVTIYADYSVSVDALRDELQRALKDSPLWDGKAWGLQVTNATEKAVECRALMSAADSSAAWDLRCEVRERLLDFLQRNYPASLPKLRTELQPAEVFLEPQ